MKELRGGRYTLLRALGEGSQGETWEARDNGATVRPDPAKLASDFEAYVRRAKCEARDNPNPRGLVAIKSFRVGKAKAWKDVELAEREATTLAKLDHPNLPRYLEHFEEDGVLHLVMEKIEGESLVPSKTKDVDAVRLLADIGDALRYLHGLTPPLVHRDIKPGNVIRRPDGSHALVDFGAVRDRLKASGGSTVVGTFGYMAPEQFQGRASPQSDLYGLAATALAMMTGTQPEELPHEGLAIDVTASLPRGTPPALVQALEAMLAPDPDHRAASIDEALGLLEQAEPKRKKRTERRAERKQKRKARKARRANEHDFPLVPWVIFQIALFAGAGAVWLATGVFVPLIIVVAVLLYGERARRRQMANDLHARVEGTSEEEGTRVRVAADDETVEEDAEEQEAEKPRGKLRR